MANKIFIGSTYATTCSPLTLLYQTTVLSRHAAKKTIKHLRASYHGPCKSWPHTYVNEE